MPNVRTIEVFQAAGLAGGPGVLPRPDNVRSHAAFSRLQRKAGCYVAGLARFHSARDCPSTRSGSPGGMLEVHATAQQPTMAAAVRAKRGGVRFDQLLGGGLLDQIATRERVQEDIAAFAGDRAEVTICLNAGGR